MERKRLTPPEHPEKMAGLSGVLAGVPAFSADELRRMFPD